MNDKWKRVQLCKPDEMLRCPYNLSEPKAGQGNPARWTLDLDIPVDENPKSLNAMLEKLQGRVREEISGRTAECFPSLRTEKMSEDQLDMCIYSIIKKEEGAKTARFKIKILMPPSAEEEARMTQTEIDRRKSQATTVYEVVHYEPASEANPDGIFEYRESDTSILKAGAYVMPVVSTSGIWMSKSNAGVSFTCQTICVKPAPASTGVAVFNLGGVSAAGIVNVVGAKRHRDDEGEPLEDMPYKPFKAESTD